MGAHPKFALPVHQQSFHQVIRQTAAGVKSHQFPMLELKQTGADRSGPNRVVGAFGQGADVIAGQVTWKPVTLPLFALAIEHGVFARSDP